VLKLAGIHTTSAVQSFDSFQRLKKKTPTTCKNLKKSITVKNSLRIHKKYMIAFLLATIVGCCIFCRHRFIGTDTRIWSQSMACV